MINPIIDYSKYDKITDDLYMIGSNLVLKFNTLLSRKMPNGDRYHYHHEYKYDTNKYNSEKSLVTIKRTFEFFLSIENLKDEGYGKDYLIIGVQNIYTIKDRFKQATKWFMDKKFQNLFVVKDNKLIIVGKPQPIVISGLPMQKEIILEPIVTSYNDQYSPGIRLYISNNNYADISIDKYMGLLYLLENINMYESAQLMLNYLQRPEFGTNLYSTSTRNYSGEEKESFTNGGVKREIKSKHQGSFFDKMKDL